MINVGSMTVSLAVPKTFLCNREGRARSGVYMLLLLVGSKCSLLEDAWWESYSAGFELFNAFGTNTRGFKMAMSFPVFSDAILNEAENILHYQYVLFHTHDFADVGHLSRSPLQTAGLNDDVDRRRNLLSQCR